MKIVKSWWSWRIEGEGDGWIFEKTFPTKWKAELALEVFKEGGRISDYWKRAREVARKRPERTGWRAREGLRPTFEEIERLKPTCEEIKEYAEKLLQSSSGGYGEVTTTDNEDYFGPRLHDTWGRKRGGHVHIDIGCCGYHLMLSDDTFIEFIKEKREKSD